MLMNDNIKADPNPLESVEDIHEIVVLLDFYGQLLTKRQFDIMDLHFNSDLSLGEIAEDLGISRQGVYDSIRKAKQALLGYEKRLGLAERFREQEKNIEKVLKSLKNMGKKSPELIGDSDYKHAMDLLGEMLDTL